MFSTEAGCIQMPDLFSRIQCLLRVVVVLTQSFPWGPSLCCMHKINYRTFVKNEQREVQTLDIFTPPHTRLFTVYSKRRSNMFLLSLSGNLLYSQHSLRICQYEQLKKECQIQRISFATMKSFISIIHHIHYCTCSVGDIYSWRPGQAAWC